MKDFKCKCKDVGRILIGLMFLVFGLLKITGFAGTVGYIASTGLPMANVLAVLAILIEVGGGIALIANKFKLYTIYTLSAYLIIITLVLHRNISDQMQLAMALKNLAILGGLLIMCPCKKCSDCGECADGACSPEQGGKSCCGGDCGCNH